MKKSVQWGLLLVLLCPVCAMAQSAFDGTWKVDLSKAQMTKKPDVLLLQNGRYQCKTCVPAVDIKADGQDQKVTGHPYYDSMAVQVVDDHTIKETDKKGGKVVANETMTVAPDGKTAHFEFTDSSNTNNGPPMSGRGDLKQVAAGPAGSHAISGSWVTSGLSGFSDNALLFTYKLDNGMLNMSTPTGQSYAVKTDGTEGPYKGDPGITSVSVKQQGGHSLVETDKRDGKVISVTKCTVEANGKTMRVTINDQLHGTTSTFVAEKQ